MKTDGKNGMTIGSVVWAGNMMQKAVQTSCDFLHISSEISRNENLSHSVIEVFSVTFKTRECKCYALLLLCVYHIYKRNSQYVYKICLN